MAISREDVLHVASLARLELSEAEIESMTRDLGKILGHIDQLSALDTADVPPTEYVVVSAVPLRADQASPGLTQESALAPAPSTLNDGFRVPSFVDD